MCDVESLTTCTFKKIVRFFTCKNSNFFIQIVHFVLFFLQQTNIFIRITTLILKMAIPPTHQSYQNRDRSKWSQEDSPGNLGSRSHLRRSPACQYYSGCHRECNSCLCWQDDGRSHSIALVELKTNKKWKVNGTAPYQTCFGIACDNQERTTYKI